MKQLLICMGVLFTIACTKTSQAPRGLTNGNANGKPVTESRIITSFPKGRVVAYFFRSDHDWNSHLSSIDLTKITDVNIAFINPNANGNFANENWTALGSLIQTLHNQSRRVYFSIGGGNPPASLATYISAANRSTLISNIVYFTTYLGFDGIDIDLENDLITADTARYAGFINDLKVAMTANYKDVNVALAKWEAADYFISSATLNKFNLINIMSYDSTGPWNPGAPGQHSSYTLAVNDFQFFLSRGVPAGKLFMGVPFYGYAFGSSLTQTGYSYSDIVTTYPGAENRDTVNIPGGGIIYYNGIPTIQSKVDYATSHGAGGISIWEIQQDVVSTDSRSLLTTIYNKLQ
ncbi:MAG: hypothetical protein JO154_10955 [Chitinophaga sp.]|uniref:glycosyl hydrolase family 18 protein n=1 Tax=Chitinophaga sp. TaxID=1869181 RepID=UPI0025C63A9F|nr:glycosyl hydrolase family 18 protein [Chitinophaga sp.]MBV8253116.1 hypothetical protein [Chitinophaga sp.]